MDVFAQTGENAVEKKISPEPCRGHTTSKNSDLIEMCMGFHHISSGYHGIYNQL